MFNATPITFAGRRGRIAFSQITNVVLSEVPMAKSGVASGANSTARQLGAALGAAVAGVERVHLERSSERFELRGLVVLRGGQLRAGVLAGDLDEFTAARNRIAELGIDSATDITSGRLFLDAGTGIGVFNAIETQTGVLEAESATGGINLSNIGLISLGKDVIKVRPFKYRGIHVKP